MLLKIQKCDTGAHLILTTHFHQEPGAHAQASAEQYPVYTWTLMSMTWGNKILALLLIELGSKIQLLIYF